MLAGDRNAAGKAQNEYGHGETGGDEDGDHQEGYVIPEADMKSQQRFHDTLFLPCACTNALKRGPGTPE